MTRASLTDVLRPALRDGYAVPGFVCLGWEDTRSFVRAAEDQRAPVILQAGPGARAHTPLPVLGAMFRHLADAADVPVVIHLDHATSIEECRTALAEGFTSVMFDGSRLPLPENIARTAEVAALAHAADASCEGEIGFVGYAEGDASFGTVPEEAERFARESGVDAMAVSIGNIHLSRDQSSKIDMARLRAIEALTEVPLVIHGGSGIAPARRAALATETRICKFNIGTELRMTFGAALRAAVLSDADRFDRVALLSETEEPMRRAARRIIGELGAAGRA
jgi:fructose-bisphosphate aldolase class II